MSRYEIYSIPPFKPKAFVNIMLSVLQFELTYSISLNLGTFIKDLIKTKLVNFRWMSLQYICKLKIGT